MYASQTLRRAASGVVHARQRDCPTAAAPQSTAAFENPSTPAPPAGRPTSRRLSRFRPVGAGERGAGNAVTAAGMKTGMSGARHDKRPTCQQATTQGTAIATRPDGAPVFHPSIFLEGIVKIYKPVRQQPPCPAVAHLLIGGEAYVLYLLMAF